MLLADLPQPDADRLELVVRHLDLTGEALPRPRLRLGVGDRGQRSRVLDLRHRRGLGGERRGELVAVDTAEPGQRAQDPPAQVEVDDDTVRQRGAAGQPVAQELRRRAATATCCWNAASCRVPPGAAPATQRAATSWMRARAADGVGRDRDQFRDRPAEGLAHAVVGVLGRQRRLEQVRAPRTGRAARAGRRCAPTPRRWRAAAGRGWRAAPGGARRASRGRAG